MLELAVVAQGKGQTDMSMPVTVIVVHMAHVAPLRLPHYLLVEVRTAGRRGQALRFSLLAYVLLRWHEQETRLVVLARTCMGKRFAQVGA
jgi:hypothetical protein